LGFRVAVVGASEKRSAFFAAQNFSEIDFPNVDHGRLATEIDRCECIENIGTTKSVIKKQLVGEFDFTESPD
jgi:hypothetical protein